MCRNYTLDCKDCDVSEEEGTFANADLEGDDCSFVDMIDHLAILNQSAWLLFCIGPNCRTAPIEWGLCVEW